MFFLYYLRWCSVDFEGCVIKFLLQRCLDVIYFSLEVVDLDIGTLDSIVDE